MMRHPVVLGVDQGTTSTKAVAIDAEGVLLASASRALTTRPGPGGSVEQDAGEMLANVIDCLREVAGQLDSGVVVRGVGLCNQTETLCVWDAVTGQPVLPAMVWQCRRGEAEIAALQNEADRAFLRDRTGLDPDPTFTASKLAWVFRHRPDVAAGIADGRLLWGTVDTWLVHALTRGATYATDPGNASRTLLFDIRQLAWDPALARRFGLALARYPEVRPSAGGFGTIPPGILAEPVPITAIMGDQQASLFGHGCFRAGEIKITYGTGAFLWRNAGPDADITAARGLLRTVAWQTNRPCYAIEGFVMTAGAALDWLASRLAEDAGGAGIVARAAACGTSAGVRLVPAFQGLAAPWWRPQARAALLGLSAASEVGHLCHATLEAVCFSVRALLDLMVPPGSATRTAIRVDGGLSHSSYFMQLQSDVLGQVLEVAAVDAVTPFGVALMAGLASGLFPDSEALRPLLQPAARHVPDPARAAYWDETYADWRRVTDAVIALG